MDGWISMEERKHIDKTFVFSDCSLLYFVKGEIQI